MLQKLDGLQDKIYAGYCLEVTNPSEEDSDYYAVHIRPVQQGLTKPHPRKPQHSQPTMCVPVLPATAHPRSREPPQVSKPLPWNNCYHPTCYDICLCIPAEQQDHFQSPYLNCFPELDKFVAEDMRYRQLLQAGPDNDRILRILYGQEEAPETDVPDYISQTESESQASQMFLAKVPGCDKLAEDLILVPVLRVDHVLSNVPEISDPSQLCGDLDIFQEIVLEYQLALYRSAVFPQPELEIDDPHFHGKFSVDSLMSTAVASGTSTEDLGSDSPEPHAFDSSLADESEDSKHHLAPVPLRKGKWRVNSLFRRAVTNLVQFVQAEFGLHLSNPFSMFHQRSRTGPEDRLRVLSSCGLIVEFSFPPKNAVLSSASSLSLSASIASSAGDVSLLGYFPVTSSFAWDSFKEQVHVLVFSAFRDGFCVVGMWRRSRM